MSEYPKIAIIYTGEFRTIQKTMPLFVQNCLHHPNHHVFAVLQNNGENIHDFILQQLGDHLQSIEYFDKMDGNYLNLKNKMLRHMNINESCKNYLIDSGSMIEYYHIYLAYFNIVEKERRDHFKYDYVIRIRCDCVITKPLSFDWSLYSKKKFGIC